MQIKEAGENYLETIYILIGREGFCRAIDICNELGYSKPTVSVAMRDFRENGFIETDADGHITLTPKGLEIAQRIYERHRILTQTLVRLGVDHETARHDACKIEHDLSAESFEKIKAYYFEIIRSDKAAKADPKR